MKAIERRKAIYECMQTQNVSSVTMFAKRFNVSSMTIRRDLDIMEGQNLIQRSYGKATIKQKQPEVSEYEFRVNQHLKEKQAIAAQAVKLIENGQSIYIDSSSTTNLVLEMITPDISPVIYTNSVSAINILIHKPWVKVFVFGGMLSNAVQCLDYSTTMIPSTELYFDIAFTSCCGFDNRQIYNNDLISVNERRIMLTNSARRVLLTDSSKLYVSGLFSICKWDMIDDFITDQALPADLSAVLKNEEVTLRIAR